MKLWIVVYRDNDGELLLDSAWDSAALAADPEVAVRQAEMVIQQPGITESHWLLIDVPDTVIGPYLTRGVPVEPSGGVRCDVDEIHSVRP